MKLSVDTDATRLVWVTSGTGSAPCEWQRVREGGSVKWANREPSVAVPVDRVNVAPLGHGARFLLSVDSMTVCSTGVAHDVSSATTDGAGDYEWLVSDADAPVHAGLDVVLGDKERFGGHAVRVVSVEMGDDGLLCRGKGW